MLKRFLLYFVPISAILGAMMGYIYYAEYKSARNLFEAKELEHINLQVSSITGDFRHIISDLMFLSEQHELKAKLDDPDSFSFNDLADDYLSLSQRKGLYDQIRFLDETGMEIIRVNYNSGAPTTVPEDRLQSKRHRYYFTKSIVLGEGEVYISPLDLNVENKEVERPLKPMIRFATPVFDSAGNKRGVIILNFFGASTIEGIRSVSTQALGDAYLLSSSGYWLIGPSAGDEWGFMFPDKLDKTFQSVYPEEWKNLKISNKGQFYTVNGLFTFDSIYPASAAEGSATPAGDEYHLKIISMVSSRALAARTNDLFDKLTQLYAVVLLLMAGGSFVLARTKQRHEEAEADLRIAEQKISAIAGAVGEGIVGIGSDSHIFYANGELHNIFGYEPEELIGQNVNVLMPGKYREVHNAAMNRYLAGGQAKSLGKRMELEGRRKNGGLFPIEIRIEETKLDGKNWFFTAAIRDITERKNSEKALRESKDSLAEAQRIASIGNWDWDIASNKLTWSDECCRIFGRDPESFEGTYEAFLDAVHPSDREHVKQSVNSALESGEDYSIDHSIILPGGEEKIVSEQGEVFKDESGKPVRLVGAVQDITERKRAEEATRRSEERYKLLVESGLLIAWELDLETFCFTFVSGQAEKLLGYSQSDWYKPNFWVDHLHPEDRDRAVEFCASSTDRGEDHTFDYRMLAADGSVFWFKDLVSVVKNPEGAPIGLRGFLLDITDRKKAEIEVAESEERFRSIFESSNDAIFIIDTQRDRIVDTNDKACILLKYPKEELLKTPVSAIHPGEMERLGEFANKVFGTGSGWTDELTCTTKLGQDIPAEISASVLAVGGDEYMIALVRDITERKRAEEALRKSEQSLAKAQKLTNLGNWEWDINKNEVTWSEQTYRIFGFEPGETEPSYEAFHGLVHPDDREMMEAALQKTLKENIPYDVEYRLNRKDGAELVIHSLGELHLDAEGKPARVVGTNHDITKRKKAEEALKRSEEQYRSLVENSSECICHIDLNGRFMYMNPGGLRMNEFESMDDILHHDCSESLRKDFKPKMAKAIETAKSGRNFHLEYMSYSKSGKRIWWSSTLSPIKDKDENVTSILRVSSDITERKEAEENLRAAKERAEKATKEKDKYISLIAHDLKAPFTSIIAFFELIAKDEKNPWYKDKKSILDSMLENSERTVTLIDEVLHTSRFETGAITLKNTFFDANNTAFEICANYGHLAREKGIELRNDVPPGSRFYADPILFSEVIQNLVSNAIKFCAEGDEISIYATYDNMASIAVKDTGVGIDDDTIPNLFRRDVRTTKIGTHGEKGTGLGMPLCADIMEAHNGALEVESVKGKGSVFYARLPNAIPKTLIIDDEKIIRMALSERIKKLNVEIIEAANGREAIEIARRSPPDLILCDVFMPGMDGLKVLQKLKEDHKTAGIPVIVITSDSRIETREKALRLGAADFIAKPIRSEELIPRVKKFIV